MKIKKLFLDCKEGRWGYFPPLVRAERRHRHPLFPPLTSSYGG